MASTNALVYRQVVTLRDGTRVLLRPMVKEDGEALAQLYGTVTADELVFFRHNVKDPRTIAGWVDDLNYDRVFPLVGLVGNQIVGCTTLHIHDGYNRHIGEVRIFLEADYRERGLGTKMVQGLIDIAKRKDLLMLEVLVIHERVNVIRAFHNAGFVTKCVFEDGYMTADGRLLDLDYLILRLRPVDEEF